MPLYPYIFNVFSFYTLVKIQIQSCFSPRIYGECAGCGVHASNVLTILDFLLREFDSVVPMAVAKVLTDDRVCLHGEVFVHFRHVHVVDEVNQPFVTRRTVHFTSFLF